MATSNFLPFNPTQSNQETDSEYLADATRTGGAGVDAIWPSTSANKTLYQVSTGIAALMQMMANKGFTVSDASLAALTTQLSNILTTADLLSNLQSVSWASSLALNAVRYNGFEIGLSGNTTLSINGQTVGQVIVLLFSQDGTGGHTVTYPGNIVGGAQPDPTPSTVSAQIFKVSAVSTLQALGPNVSVNGMGGMALGAVNPASVNASTLQIAGTAPAGQVLTGNGTDYVPTVAPGFTSGSNSNGYWEVNPAGRITQWGQAFSLPDNSPIVINFPIAFVSACQSCVANDSRGAGNPRTIECYNLTTTGFTAIASGSGASIYFIATGY